jgi:hypothetical protein
MNIGPPTNVVRGGAHNSPIVKIDAKARQKVPGWATAGLPPKVKAVFDAFVEVFRENRWHYAAGSFPGMMTNEILLGQQTMQQLQGQFGIEPTMDCGRIRNLLANTFSALLPVTVSDARVTGLFVTKPLGAPPPGVQGEFRCIDANVYGNVRTGTKPYQLVGQCLFEDHYAVKVNETGTIYDACLVSTYANIDVVVETLLKRSPGDAQSLIQRTPPPPGGALPITYRALTAESPNGFTAGYMRV